MLAKRIIPCLDIKGGRTVKGTNFKSLQDAGDPVELAKRYEIEQADELIFLDITATENKSKLLVELVQKLSKELSIPFSVGGGIQSVQDAYQILQHGADKISINSAAIYNPQLINELSEAFGAQCIIIAVDASFIQGAWRVFTHGGKKATDLFLLDWIQEAENRGAGEILFTSMDHDGVKNGYANEALCQISESSSLPLIASGGAGKMEHFRDTFLDGKADAALAASVFHFQEINIKHLKKYLQSEQIEVRI